MLGVNMLQVDSNLTYRPNIIINWQKNIRNKDIYSNFCTCNHLAFFHTEILDYFRSMSLQANIHKNGSEQIYHFYWSRWLKFLEIVMCQSVDQFRVLLASCELSLLNIVWYISMLCARVHVWKCVCARDKLALLNMVFRAANFHWTIIFF